MKELESDKIKAAVRHELATQFALTMAEVLRSHHEKLVHSNASALLYADDPLGFRVLKEASTVFAETLEAMLNTVQYDKLIRRTQYQKGEFYFDQEIERLVASFLEKLS